MGVTDKGATVLVRVVGRRCYRFLGQMSVPDTAAIRAERDVRWSEMIGSSTHLLLKNADNFLHVKGRSTLLDSLWSDLICWSSCGLSSSGGPFSCIDDAYVCRECSCSSIATDLDYHVVKNAGNFLHVEGRSSTIGFVVVVSH
ncbi:hypothetical protein TIFTF001_003977 [Ficus carica]|uniref:Uncharacterized protein n=1 Tax=Ficus carica TaxID=3494 RepID=A0AA88CWZ7_FICCA|nr:hypothetical protein TIFTF001_003977 [Ficus carica]